MAFQPSDSTAPVARCDVQRRSEGLVVSCSGAWTVAAVNSVDEALRGVAPTPGERVVFDLAQVEQLDSAGVMLLARLIRRLEADGHPMEAVGAPDAQLPLFNAIRHLEIAPPPVIRRPATVVQVLENIGRSMAGIATEYRGSLSFLGRTIASLGRSLISPRRLRITSIFHHTEATGLDAVAINAVLCFLVGAVIASICIDMLNLFGAGALTVNVMGYAFLRELGVLLVAIVVAGRSGSAFTAQIGSMRSHEEIDAIRTLGLDPMEILVLPRVIALVVVMPLLVFVGDMLGLVGGALACKWGLGMSGTQYWVTLQDTIEVRHFWVGIIKAPVFGFLIAMIGCYQGFLVGGSAESVGEHTTKSVVDSIFAVIVADAFFAIYFMYIKF